jgi:hypothetical protein
MSHPAAATLSSLSVAFAQQTEQEHLAVETFPETTVRRRAPVKQLISHIGGTLLPKLPQVQACRMRMALSLKENHVGSSHSRFIGMTDRSLHQWAEQTVDVAYRQIWRKLLPNLADNKRIDWLQTHIPEEYAPLAEQADKLARRQALWHVKRLTGFDASEIGIIRDYALLSNHATLQNQQNARNLVLAKLCALAPEDDTPDVIRSHNTEPFIRQTFRCRFGVIGRDDLAKSLQTRRIPDKPWHLCNVGDVIQDARGFWIVDYKTPDERSSAAYLRNGVSEDWIDQLHWHAYGGNYGDSPIPIAGMILVMQDALTRDLIPFEIPYDPNRMETILKGATALWNDCVMRGTLPECPQPSLFQIDNSAIQSITEKLDRVVILKSLQDHTENLATQVENRLMAEVQAIGKAEAIRTLGGDPSVHLSAYPSYQVIQSETLGPTAAFKTALPPAIESALRSLREAISAFSPEE